jgi:hypothetical protein
MSRLRVSLLGPFEVTLDGAAVLRFRGDTARALLAYLAVHPGTAFGRAQLAALLWPDHPEAVALQNLRQALRRLRTAIGDAEADPPFLLATRATIALHPEGDYSCDVTAFAEAVAASKAHRHRRRLKAHPRAGLACRRARQQGCRRCNAGRERLPPPCRSAAHSRLSAEQPTRSSTAHRDIARGRKVGCPADVTGWAKRIHLRRRSDRRPVPRQLDNVRSLFSGRLRVGA